jgi:putative acetyltransferase
MRIRPEAPDDVEAIRAVNLAAFESSAEASLVDALRGVANPYLSLVAEDDGAVVGHILFTPVQVPDMTTLVVGLAPMAVLPDRQRAGIGSALVRAGLDGCRALNASAAIVLGHPEYYPRFGFVPADHFGLTSEYDVPADVFMALELQPGALASATGIVKYHPAFNAL